MAVIIAGERSGSGKTTIAIALLSFLVRQGHSVQSFKVGPDYIDPMFHTAITGRSCRNLDPILTSEDYVKSCFLQQGWGVDAVIIEGVMGLFDGIPKEDSFCKDYASTAHIARLLNLPVLLTIDCSRLSGSIAAIARGYSSFDPEVKIAGLILNRVGSDRHLELLKEALEPLKIPILGVLRREEEITIPDRHLGLVPTDELDNFHRLCDRLADLAQNCFNWEQLFPLLSPPLSSSSPTLPPSPVKISIAIARDRAFSFYYQDNLDILASLGVELIPWSPLEDAALPNNIQGLYFGGGFPEMFARELAENQSAREAVFQAIRGGMPTYAECGGLMYLCEKLVDFAGNSWEMLGILPTESRMEKRLTLGYRKAIALQNSSFFKQGETVWGHEFHRSDLTCEPTHPVFSLQGYRSPVKMEGWSLYNLHASYLHLHWGTQKNIPERFLHAI